MVENPTIKDLRKFKLTLLILPVIPSVILYYKNHVHLAMLFFEICWVLLLTLFVARLFGKNIDKPIYHFVRIILKFLGMVISAIALTITWICAILPTAIVAKIKGRDRLVLKKKNVNSYWKDVKSSEQTYENQY